MVSTYAGTGDAAELDGSRLSAKFLRPHGVAFVGSTLYVSDSNGQTIRAISPAGTVTTVAGSSTLNAYLDATGTSARFNYPTALVARSDGVLLIPDSGNNRIRTLTPAGVVSTLAGSGASGSSDNVDPLLATFGYDGINFNGGIRSLALSTTGILYMGDVVNCNIRAMNAAGGAVTTYAGSAAGSTCGNVDATGTNARFGSSIFGLAVSPLDGSLWVGDGGYKRIRRVISGDFVTEGVVQHLAGSAAGTAGYLDGVGSAALFTFPCGLQFDPSSYTGVAFVVDSKYIRTLTPAGVVGTLAGTGAQGSSNGECLQASFFGALAATADTEGNLYVAEWDNNLVRKVTRTQSS